MSHRALNADQFMKMVDPTYASTWEHVERKVTSEAGSDYLTSLGNAMKAGTVEPVRVVRGANILLDGHHRVVAAKNMGLDISYREVDI